MLLRECYIDDYLIALRVGGAQNQFIMLAIGKDLGKFV